MEGKKEYRIQGEGGSRHAYSEEEVHGFAGLINMLLKEDEHASRHLPLDPKTDDLFEKVGDGIILAKLIYKINSSAFDLRALNKKETLNVFQTKENLNLAISAAKFIGCKIISISPEFIMERRKHIILGIVWQILKESILATINLKDHPYLVRLLKDGEDISDFKNLPPEDILLRWINYHLENAGHDRRVKNFGEDLKDGINYTVLMNQLNSGVCDKSGLNMDPENRCSKVIEDSKKLGVETVIGGRDIQSANPKLNLIFCSLLFNACPGLKPEESDYKAVKQVEEEAEDPNDTREERSFRVWANSQDIDWAASGFNLDRINNLYEDVKDGLVLLKLLERVSPNDTVEWKKAAMNPNNKFKKVQNANYAVELGKKLGFSLVNVGGTDIAEGNKKLILALVWQMVRKHTLGMLGGTTEDELLKWANARVPQDAQIAKFQDKSISNCKFLFQLLKSVEPKAINWELVIEEKPDQKLDEEQIKLNAKYAITVARMLGATVFCVWEDIRDVKPKMIMTFVAAIAAIEKQSKDDRKAMPEFNAKEGTTK